MREKEVKLHYTKKSLAMLEKEKTWKKIER